jgi:hypothetical protein
MYIPGIPDDGILIKLSIIVFLFKMNNNSEIALNL